LLEHHCERDAVKRVFGASGVHELYLRQFGCFCAFNSLGWPLSTGQPNDERCLVEHEILG